MVPCALPSCPSRPTIPARRFVPPIPGTGHNGRMTESGPTDRPRTVSSPTPSAPPVASASTWGRWPAWARPSPCSTRAGAVTAAAPTSSSGSSRPTGGPGPPKLIRDLEVVPRKVVTYRDSQFEEMDVDAVLARQAGAGAGRRAGPHQRPRVGAPREAVAGRHRARRCRDRRDHDGQRPAPREHRRRRRAHDRHQGARAGARLGRAPGRPAGADRLVARGTAPADGPRQHLSGREGARRADPLLPSREPGGAARAGSALRGRRDRGGAPRLPP